MNGYKSTCDMELGSCESELLHWRTLTSQFSHGDGVNLCLQSICNLTLKYVTDFTPYTTSEVLETRPTFKKLPKPKKNKNQQENGMTWCYLFIFNHITIAFEFGLWRLDVMSCVLAIANGNFSYREVSTTGSAPCRRGACCARCRCVGQRDR